MGSRIGHNAPMDETRITSMAMQLGQKTNAIDAGVAVEQLKTDLAGDKSSLVKILELALKQAINGSAAQAQIGVAYSEVNLEIDPANKSAIAWKKRWETALGPRLQKEGIHL